MTGGDFDAPFALLYKLEKEAVLMVLRYFACMLPHRSSSEYLLERCQYPQCCHGLYRSFELRLIKCQPIASQISPTLKKLGHTPSPILLTFGRLRGVSTILLPSETGLTSNLNCSLHHHGRRGHNGVHTSHWMACI
jgi:hypothetical protein